MLKEKFIELYEREATHNDNSWRYVEISPSLFTELLSSGLTVDTLLLNKRISIEILRELMHHPDPRVRCMVADKRASATLLTELSSDPDVSVRLRVCCNAKADRRVLEKLAGDTEPAVRVAALRRLEAKFQ